MKFILYRSTKKLHFYYITNQQLDQRVAATPHYNILSAIYKPLVHSNFCFVHSYSLFIHYR